MLRKVEAGMSFDMAEPDQLKMLSKAFSDHCLQHGVRGDMDREQIAVRVMALLRQGVIDPAQISDELGRVR
ncbi:MAG: hypothetical protein E5W74_19840 [Mesorhizobium sp.]|uniref:hypothetical protein n=1 Tax=Mesorhizobium sp. TaxID=1871066 RepID=UPI00122A737F|nr:hypothetical protein [Mesorhizobium sp.]TIT09456.1 MAG: hypothetical protein E5W74_19840 [Mesorhizobium sp.]